jgi:hypothetical protein
MLADQHFQHQPVDLVVATVVGQHPHLLFRLPVAVHPAFPLLVPGRIPAEVVVEHSVEPRCRLMPSLWQVGGSRSAFSSRRMGDPGSPLSRGSNPVMQTTSTL